MKFYTWCNNSKSDKIQRLLDSAKLQNIDVETIGEGRDVHEGGKLNGKNIWLYEKVCELDENEIVVCTDSFDVIYLTNADEIEQKFLEMNAKIVYSTECLYNHQDSKFLEYYKKLGKGKHYKFLNSGAMVGYAKNIKEKFEVILKYLQTDIEESASYNQGRIGKYIAENSDKVKLDYDCEIFWTDQNFNNPPPINKVTHPKYLEIGINELKQKILRNGRMYNTITDNYPCIFHCPYVRHTHKLISTAWDYIKTTK
jgi:uncharacterized protein with PIN domain